MIAAERSVTINTDRDNKMCLCTHKQVHELSRPEALLSLGDFFALQENKSTAEKKLFLHRTPNWCIIKEYERMTEPLVRYQDNGGHGYGFAYT